MPERDELRDALPREALAGGRALVLYDGVCALCDGLVKFLLRRDRRDRLRFAALQSPLGRALVVAAGGDPDEVSTLYVITDGPERLRVRTRGRAALTAIAALGGIYRAGGWLRVLPALLLDGVYRLVARSRYRVFGRFESCRLPEPGDRDKFLDVAEP